MSKQNMFLYGNAELLEKFAEHFSKLAESGDNVPDKIVYTVDDTNESSSIKRSARKIFFEKCNNTKPIKKVAFDTRRVNQSSQRNPRANLQNWHRTDPFVSNQLDEKLKTFSKLNDVLNTIADEFTNDKDYIGSYASELHEHVKRGLRTEIKDGDYFDPHISYLEQLVFARYRLSMDDLQKKSSYELKTAILAKDENLINKISEKSEQSKVSVSAAPTGSLKTNGVSEYNHENIIQALFGGSHFRKVNEKKVQRTITITINDEVKE